MQAAYAKATVGIGDDVYFVDADRDVCEAGFVLSVDRLVTIRLYDACDDIQTTWDHVYTVDQIDN